jgi:hypothetical protein
MGSGGRRKSDRGVIQIPRSKRIMTGRDNAAMIAVVGGNGHTSPPTRAQDQCRTFGLVRPGNATGVAAAGMAIWGIFKDPKVTVRSQAGDLGDAPSQVARFFIEERDRRGGASLKGFVLKSTPRDVRVRLCLN